MYAIDFEYDNKKLSDFGYIICIIDGNHGVEISSVGSNITFNKVQKFYGRKHSLTSTQYNECITTTFHICKDPDKYEINDMMLTAEDIRFLMRWLNRRDFLPFRINPYGDKFRNDDPGNITFYASFNVSKIKIGEIPYGLELTMETNSPFAYGWKIDLDLSFTEDSLTGKISDVNEEIGATYPDVKIICSKPGDLEISCAESGTVTVIKNCSAGEVINMYGDSLVITSNLPSHDLSFDFNYEFLKICNSFDNDVNTITVSLPCDIHLAYIPTVKNTP